MEKRQREREILSERGRESERRRKRAFEIAILLQIH